MMVSTVVTLLLLSTLNLANSVPLSWPRNDPDSELTPPMTIASTYVANLTRRHGYPPMERYETETKDGYILAMYLIPQKKRFSSKTVFLSHGMMSSSDCWFFNEPERIFPFKLHDLGYNVMLGNFRGTSHSPNHTKLLSNSTEYWDFSWDEIGREDLAAMIDHTLEVTQQKKLFLIGHSMGTTTAFVLLSEKPEYNDKIQKFIALAPAVFHGHSTSPLRLYVTPLLKTWGSEKLLNFAFAPGKFPPEKLHLNDWLRKFRPGLMKGMEEENEEDDKDKENEIQDFNFNSTDSGLQLATKIILNFIPTHFGKETFQTRISTDLESASLRTLLHYGQGMNYGTFQRYDYGGLSNLPTYGSWWVPTYDLTKITCPVSLFWSASDPFSVEEDVQMLKEALTQSTDVQVFELENVTHVDYILSKRLDQVLIPKVIECLTHSE